VIPADVSNIGRACACVNVFEQLCLSGACYVLYRKESITAVQLLPELVGLPRLLQYRRLHDL